ncbi:MAG: amidase domain-containing protein [Clostridia bacterium]|nr:amidase domain-containing protein [Clostridia bacterium]
MILEKEYVRENAVLYARKYAFARNPLFTTFEGIGGNCTNFVSQCVLAGSCVMNFTPVFGWYYLSLNRRSPSWSGVEFFYNFITSNTDVGPFGTEVDVSLVEIGDVVQLADDTGDFYHTLLISKIENGEIYICANTNDALDKPLSEYTYASSRFIHILGVRYDTRFRVDCFQSLYDPPIPPSTDSDEGAGNSSDTVPPPQNESPEADNISPQAENNIQPTPPTDNQ